MSKLILTAPVRGWSAPLDEVPDPVFADRMLGDGLAIDPTGDTLHAPCDATVIAVHPTRHAVSLRAAGGAEILIHVGLDTVGLGGEGFTVHVADGQAVKAGEPLIGFDLDLLARKARSLITPIVVTNRDAFDIVRRHQDGAVAVGDFLMELVPTGAQGARESTVEVAAGDEIIRELTVPLKHGLHARPAARVAALAGTVAAELTVVFGARRASAKSPVALMGLAIRHGDAIALVARGPDAREAVEVVAALIAGGMGEDGPPEEEAVAADLVAASGPVLVGGVGMLRGVMAAPGLAIGPAVRLAAAEIVVAEAGRGIDLEQAALTAALDAVAARLTAAAEAGDPARRSILAAHLAFLRDPELETAARRLIADGKGAGFGWRGAVGGHVEALRGLGDRRMAERIDDLIDLERQVLRALAKEEGDGETDEARALPPGAILLADELLPSQLMGLDAARLGGVAVAKGGPTSHVAILAAAMGLPALVAVGAELLAVSDGASLILDADGGSLRVGPDAAALEAAQMALAARQDHRAAARSAAHAPSRMADGRSIEVYANLGSLADAVAAVAQGAEGCGLLRTEFLFLDRDTPPEEDEQARQYQAIATALDGRPLIVRTLDVGGDKAAPYLPIPAEDNPALGLRGVRVSLWRPRLLKTQLRAILRVAPAGQVKIMVPMVASLDELRAVRAVLDEAKRELKITTPVELGVMIETPAAAITADLLAAEADFLSIGTNDLTQYVLAMDRGNPELATRLDALHPAVLRLIAATCDGGAAHGRWVGVCGGLASDLLAAPILIGLGVTELSATAAMVPELKAWVRTLTLEACQALARQALIQTSPEAVRGLAKAFQAGA